MLKMNRIKHDEQKFKKKMKEFKTYETPTINVIYCMIEQGFAGSGLNADIHDATEQEEEGF